MKLTFAPLLLTLTLTLAGCQSTMQRIADCKTGDWRVIGHKDGASGEKADFADRKDFCDDHQTIAADAAASYAGGWSAGNAEFWSSRGEADGRAAIPLTAAWEQRAASEEVRKKNTPQSRPAYESGWMLGNSAYWTDLGRKEGTAGQSHTRREQARAQAVRQTIRFDEQAYDQGWQAGNRQFWEDAGFSDARSGIPDAEFRNRAAKAREAGVQVQEDAYRKAWNAELVNYWRKLGKEDATSGRELGSRKREAAQRGLKLLEREYLQAWEEGLTHYWLDAGARDGYGYPYQWEARAANARRDGVFVIHNSRAAYGDAWTAGNARYCTSANAFEWGRGSQPMAIEVCAAALQPGLRRAYIVGGQYQQVSLRYEHAGDRVRDHERRMKDERRRMERAEKDLRAERERKPPSDKEMRRLEGERKDAENDMRRAQRDRDDAARNADRYSDEMYSLKREALAY